MAHELQRVFTFLKGWKERKEGWTKRKDYPQNPDYLQSVSLQVKFAKSRLDLKKIITTIF